MNSADLREAHGMKGILSPAGREVAKSLAPRLRTTGLVATLSWLRHANKNEGKRDVATLFTDRFGEGIEQLDTVDLVQRYRDALRLTEALHVVLRERTKEGT